MFHDEIWVEISPWGLQNPFSGKFWYLNMFRTIFGKIEILVFLYPKIPKNQFLGLEISILGRSPAKSAEIWKKEYVNFFQKENPSLNGYSFLIYPHFCENWPEPKKTTFSHFLQNTVLDPKRHKILKIFEKFRFWAFRKVYGLWGYFRPKKSYSHLKFQHTTVTHLCFEFSNVLIS